MKNILILLFIVASHAAMGQNPGYFNKKNVVEFAANGQYPLGANILSWMNGTPIYAVKNGAIQESGDHFDYGFRIGYMRTLNRHFGVGLEAGMDYFSAQRKNHQLYTLNYYSMVFDKTDISSFSIMPKIEFSNQAGTLPMGISHQLGFGYNSYKPVERAYYFAKLNNTKVSEGELNTISLEDSRYKEKPVVSFTLMYAVNMRTPLTKFLFLNYGIRYTLNLFPEVASIYNSDNNDDEPSYSEIMNVDREELRSLVKSRKQLSFIQASLGLTFVF